MNESHTIFFHHNVTCYVHDLKCTCWATRCRNQSLQELSTYCYIRLGGIYISFNYSYWSYRLDPFPP